jgi:biopolymer transport protein ExbD
MENGNIYWNMGIERPQLVDFKQMRALLQEKNASNPKLITLIKVDRKAKYHNMVDILDEIQLANVVRFSLAPMLEQDIKEVEKVL